MKKINKIKQAILDLLQDISSLETDEDIEIQSKLYGRGVFDTRIFPKGLTFILQDEYVKTEVTIKCKDLH
jgi:hypothetical protein